MTGFFLDDHAKTQGKNTQGSTKTQGKFSLKTQGIGGFLSDFQQNTRYRRFTRLSEGWKAKIYLVQPLISTEKIFFSKIEGYREENSRLYW